MSPSTLNPFLHSPPPLVPHYTKNSRFSVQKQPVSKPSAINSRPSLSAMMAKGSVNSDDLTVVGATYNTVGSGDWFLGDFDYDGACDSDDVTVIGALYDPTA